MSSVSRPSALPNTVGYLVSEVGRLYRLALDRKMAQMGFARSEWWVMVFLSRMDGCSQQDLADVTDLGKSAITKLLDKLEQRGIVRREPDPNDGRSKRVFLTHEVHGMVQQIIRDVDDLETASLTPFSDAAAGQLVGMLTQLRERLLSLPQR